MPKVKTPPKRHCPICDVKHLPGEHLQRRLPYEPMVTQSTAPLKEQPNFPVPVLADPAPTTSEGGEARESNEKRPSGNIGTHRGGKNLLTGSKGIRPILVPQPKIEMGRGKNSEVLVIFDEAKDAEMDIPQQSNGTPSIPQLGPGVYEKISPDIYHQQNSFSRGDMLLAAVPAKLKWHKDHPQIDKPTPAKILGGAFHTKLLEPEVFDSRYILSRYAEYRTNEAKTWRDEQTDKGLTVLSKEDIDMIDQMCQSCREQANFHKVFARAGMRRELTVVAKDPATGLLLRARYDIVPGGNVIPDIKSAMDASPEGFGKAAWNMEYGAQAAHYLYVWNLAHPNNQRREFVFLVQEKDPPYLSNMFITPYSLIEYWDKILRARRYVIAQCLATNTWPGYDVHPLERNEFELPRYAVYDIEKTQDNG